MNDQVTPAALSERREDGAARAAPGQERYLNELVSAFFAPAMCLSGRDGQVRPSGAQGLYVQDLRALSQLLVTVAGKEPVPLGYDLMGGEANQFHGIVAGSGADGADPRVFVLRERAVNPEGLVERFTIESHLAPALACRLELKLACDLAGVASVNAGRRPPPRLAGATPDGLAWDLAGRCRVTATGSPSPAAVDPEQGSIAWDLSVPAGRRAMVSLAVHFEEGSGLPPVAAAPARRERLDRHLDRPEVVAGDHRLSRLVTLSLADLECLRMVVPGNPQDVFVAAGVPWYLTLFGRDSIWAARMLLPLGTELALGTLRALARRQGSSSDVRTGEQPGKILHEVRHAATYHDREGEARRRSTSLPPVYYGTVDATLLWVCLLHDAWKWGAAEAEVESLLGPVQRCLDWMAGVTDCSPDGFVKYIDESGRGLANQGWKDSYDGVQFRDGRLASPPIALCEVQGYAYEAASAGAELLDWFGRPGADRWRDFAARLAERFRERFWVTDAGGPYPAIALQGDGTPVDSLTSNIGHLLGTGLLDEHESELVARRLGGPDLNSGFGLRTLAASSDGFNPLSYHCGSVWAHDTTIAVAGLSRSRGAAAQEAAASLVEGLLSAAEGFRYRLPELYGGHEKAGRAAPLPYPPSCRPQAWAAASSISVLASLVGLQPDVPRGRVALAPLAPLVGAAGVERVAGLRLAGVPVTVEIGASGLARLTGAPPGLQVLS
ncbi:MAG: glycogen debranching N-terminal domain-containing protein [Acidimicrobiales bacterium]